MKSKRCVIKAERDVVVEEFNLEEREPKDNEILIETRYSLISPGTETANYSALDKNVFVQGSWCAYPWVAGYTAVGKVLKAGKTRQNYKPGDLAMAQAPHAGHSWVNTEGQINAVIPATLDARRAPFSRLAAISYTAVHQSSMKAGDRVLVVGLGTIGNLAAQLFRESGAKVAGMDPSPRRRQLAEKSGVTAVYDPAAEGDKLESVTRALGGWPRIIVEAVGDAALAYQCMNIAAKGEGSEVILLGSPRKSTPMDGRDIFSLIHTRGIRMTGAHEGLIPKIPATKGGPSVEQNLAKLIPWIQQDKVKVEPMISHVMYPAQIKEAYEGLMNKKEEFVGVLLDWSRY